MADAPNTADWLQGIGTVAAFALTGAGLLWEARARRLERFDQDQALARGLVMTWYPTDWAETDDNTGVTNGAKSVGVSIHNYCTEPVINVALLDVPRYEGPTIIAPGATFRTGFKLAEPLFGEVTADFDRLMPLPFVDYQVGGRRWARRGPEEPIPWPPRRSPASLWSRSRRNSTKIGA